MVPSTVTAPWPSPPAQETFGSFPYPPGEYVDETGHLIIDEKEFLLIMKMKDLKEEYRAAYTELQDLKAEIQYCQHLVDQCRNKLIAGTVSEQPRAQPGCVRAARHRNTSQPCCQAPVVLCCGFPYCLPDFLFFFY